MLLYQYLQHSARRFPGKTALLCGGKGYTYAELSISSDALASYLHREGLTKGERVIIYLENSVEAVIAIFGTLQAGGCIIVVNPTTPPERLAFLIENSGCRFLCMSDAKAEAVRQAEARCARSLRKIIVGTAAGSPGDVSFSDVVREESGNAPVSLISIDLAAIIYTSGSTGKPKGVTLTHLNVDTVADSVAEYLENSADDIILCALQLSFGYGLLQLLVTFRTGATLVLEKGYGYPYDLIKKIKEHKVTGFAGAPTLFALLLQLSNLDQEDFSCLRYITNAAAAMPQAFIPKLQKVFPHTRIYLMHGLTEVLRTTFLPPEEIDKRPTSVGRGMKNVELWIEDADGNRLGAGEAGELVVRGANVMQGYWNDPEGTSKVLLPGPYPWERVMHTGDLFTVDAEGFFHFVARMDEVIKSRGEKVSPLEVENVLLAMDEVFECRVIGVPDPILGQAVKAEIVLKDSRTLDEKHVKAHCRLHLEDYRVPQIVQFVEAIPKTQGGKIRRVP